MQQLNPVKSTRCLLFILVSIFLFLTGFKINGYIVKEMDAAFRADPKKSDVSQVVDRFFPPGIKVSEALNYLHEQGFEIVEYDYDGFHPWPKGSWSRRYDSESHRKAAGILKKGQLKYSAKKYYDRYLIFLLQGKRAVVIIHSDGEKVLQAQGFIHILGL